MSPHDVVYCMDETNRWESRSDRAGARRSKRRKHIDRATETRASKAWRKRRSELRDGDDDRVSDEDEPSDSVGIPKFPASAIPMEACPHETEACATMWLAVIATTVKDLEELGHLQRLPRRTRQERDKAKILAADAPAEFLEGPMFREICELLGLEPNWVCREYDLSRFGLRNC